MGTAANDEANFIVTDHSIKSIMSDKGKTNNGINRVYHCPEFHKEIGPSGGEAVSEEYGPHLFLFGSCVLLG